MGGGGWSTWASRGTCVSVRVVRSQPAESRGASWNGRTSSSPLTGGALTPLFWSHVRPYGEVNLGTDALVGILHANVNGPSRRSVSTESEPGPSDLLPPFTRVPACQTAVILDGSARREMSLSGSPSTTRMSASKPSCRRPERQDRPRAGPGRSPQIGRQHDAVTHRHGDIGVDVQAHPVLPVRERRYRLSIQWLKAA